MNPLDRRDLLYRGHYYTPLALAILLKNIKAIKILLRKQASVISGKGISYESIIKDKRIYNIVCKHHLVFK